MLVGQFTTLVKTDAIANRKHVMLVNAELDATAGPILKVIADRAGVVITNADGDEPSVAMNMFRFVRVCDTIVGSPGSCWS